MTDCLMMIDVQQGFFDDPTQHVPDRIRELLDRRSYDHVVCTRFINSGEGPYVNFMDWHRFMPGTEETELHPFVQEVSERVFVKSVYTSLTPEFMDFMETEGIDEVHLVGIDTDCCILATALALFERDIPFKVILECCASNGGIESHDAAIRVLERLVGEGALVRDTF